MYRTQEGHYIDVSKEAYALLTELDTQLKKMEQRAIDLKLQRLALLRKLEGKKEHDQD